MKFLILGLSGLARSGKDTVARYLQKKHNMRLYAFADPIKKAAEQMFGIPLNYFYDDDLKEKVIEEWGFSPRQIAQLIGTEGGRDLFRQDIWIKRAEVELNRVMNCSVNFNAFSGFTVTDVRFENEAEMIRSKGGIIIHVSRDSAKKVNEHVSESGIECDSNDYVIKNDGTLEELYKNVDDVLVSIYEGK